MRKFELIKPLRKSSIPPKSREQRTKEGFMKKELLRLMLLSLLKERDMSSFDAWNEIKNRTDESFETSLNEVVTELFYMEQEYLIDFYTNIDSKISKANIYKIEPLCVEYLDFIRDLYKDRTSAYKLFNSTI